jgi:hypothetical protein
VIGVASVAMQIHDLPFLTQVSMKCSRWVLPWASLVAMTPMEMAMLPLSSALQNRHVSRFLALTPPRS